MEWSIACQISKCILCQLPTYAFIIHLFQGFWMFASTLMSKDVCPTNSFISTFIYEVS